MKNLQTGYIAPQYNLIYDEQLTTVDNYTITDTYKQKLLNLVNWNANTDQTQTNKLTNNLITFEQDWNAITPLVNNKISPVDGNTQLPMSHDNAPRPRTYSAWKQEKKDKHAVTLKQASPMSTKRHNFHNIREYFDRITHPRTLNINANIEEVNKIELQIYQ